MDTKLYVGNLSYNTTEKDISALFSDAGTVISVALIRDRSTGQSKGFAFVEMSSQSEAEQAIKDLNGKSIDNRNIKVNIARPPEKKRSNSDNYNQNRRGSGSKGKDRRKGGGSRRY